MVRHDSLATAIFERGVEAVASMVVLESEPESDTDESRHWIYTHGMRKFARPDVSVHNVANHQIQLVSQLVGVLHFVDDRRDHDPHRQRMSFPELNLTVETTLKAN